MKLYELTLDRRKTLSGQASGLLSFTGIIQTVFLGLLVTLATSTNAQETLMLNNNNLLVVPLLAVGFVTFIITIVLALYAYFEPKWVPVPEVINESEMMDENGLKIHDINKLEDIWATRFDEYYQKPENIDVVAFEMQLMQGITFNKAVTNSKYKILRAAYVSLAISLLLLAVFGFYIISAIL